MRPARAADAERLTVLLAQLGYPSEPAQVRRRLAALLNSPDHHILVAPPARGYIRVDRVLSLEDDEHAQITGLVVDTASRRSGVGHALVEAAEQWAAEQGLATVVVRSNVVRPESHPFYERIGYRRTATSHVYRKEL